MQKWNNQHVTSVGQKKIWVPDRIQTYDLPNTGQARYPLELQRTHGEWGHILGSYLTRVLHTARINKVDVALCGERNERWKILSSVKQMWKWNNQHVTSMGQRKNLSPQQDSNLWPPRSYQKYVENCLKLILCLTSELSLLYIFFPENLLTYFYFFLGHYLIRVWEQQPKWHLLM